MMKLVKNSRQSPLPVSASTPSLPLSPLTTDVQTPSPRQSVGYSRKGKEKERNPPTSFSLGRALSFGRKRSRDMNRVDDPIEKAFVGLCLEEDPKRTQHSHSQPSSPFAHHPFSQRASASSQHVDCASRYRLDIASSTPSIFQPRDENPLMIASPSEYPGTLPIPNRRRSVPPQRLKRPPEPAILEGVELKPQWNVGYTDAELNSYRPEPLHTGPFGASPEAPSRPLTHTSVPEAMSELERQPSAASYTSASGSATEESCIVQTPRDDTEPLTRRESFGEMFDQANMGNQMIGAAFDDEIVRDIFPRNPMLDFAETRPPSPTDSNPQSTITFQSSSTSSTARGTLIRSYTSPRTSDSAGDAHPFTRIRSASLGHRSTMTTSVYSVGEVITAAQGIVSPARAVQFDDGQTEARSTDPIERLRLLSDDTKRASKVKAPRSSLTLRRPPPPPHLETKTTTSTPALHRPPLPSRSSSLSQLWRRFSTSSKGKRDAPIPPKRQSSLFPPEDAPRVPPPVSPGDIQRLMDRASRGKARQSAGTENIPALPPSALYIAARNSSLAELPLAAAPISPSRTRDEAHSRSVLIESPESLRSATREKRRRYRQTLVEIKDDAVFQRVLQDLAQLQSEEVLEMRPARQSRGEDIGAWFVTRELIQGERRHGRLLARGVMIVRGAEPRRHRRGISFSDALPPSGILLDHLPRLLAVSLTLSSRFEHDPSPAGVALAFEAMEGELSREIGLWAGQVGHLIAAGLTGVEKSPGGSRQGSIGDLADDPDERLGLADIIMTPITRALRYKLLFTELSDKLPLESRARDKVDSALLAAARLAAECDQRQDYDLDDLRRPARSLSFVDTKVGRKKRAKSMGPSGARGEQAAVTGIDRVPV